MQKLTGIVGVYDGCVTVGFVLLVTVVDVAVVVVIIGASDGGNVDNSTLSKPLASLNTVVSSSSSLYSVLFSVVI